MPVVFSAWVILAFVALVAFAVIAATVSSGSNYGCKVCSHNNPCSQHHRKNIVQGVAIFVFLAIVGNLATFGFSRTTSDDNRVSADTLMQSIHLTPGHAYPIAIGEKQNGFSGSAHMWSALLFGGGGATIASTVKVHLLLTNGDGETWPITVPFGKIGIRATNSPNNTAKLSIQNKDIYLALDTTYGKQKTVSHTCTPIIQSGFLASRCVDKHVFVPSDDTMSANPQGLLDKYLNTITLYINKSQYADLNK